jgi:hypothetical protein
LAGDLFHPASSKVPTSFWKNNNVKISIEEKSLANRQLAAKPGSLDAVKVLLKKGADTKRRDVRNRTATDWARADEYYSIAIKIEAASFRGRKANVIQ